MSSNLDLAGVEVVAPNFKRRMTGVTRTIIQLTPLQAKRVRIATLGPGLPLGLPRLHWTALPALLRKPACRRFRIWHARRNIEMVGGLILRDLLRAPLKLVFTSSAQRDHKPPTRWMLRRMDVVIATSERSGSYLQVPHTVIMHGVDLEHFHPSHSTQDTLWASGLRGKRTIGCFGRIRRQKGTDLFVDAMTVLLPDYPDWTAVVIGRVTAEHASFFRSLKARIAAAGLTDRIVFHHEVGDISSWYRRLDLYVAPARNEGFGLTPLEAMASGTAVVASDAGAHVNLIESGTTGTIVPAGDGASLAVAVRHYVADPDLRQRHGEAGLNHVKRHFALTIEADAISEVYESMWAHHVGFASVIHDR